jgi:hypothetical protein
MTITAKIVDNYITKYRKAARAEVASYRRYRPHFGVAIQAAVKYDPINGRKHRHQYKLPRKVLNAMAETLLAAQETLTAMTEFDALHGVVKVRAVEGVGPLAVYDFAHRIGMFLGIEPQLVYLHAGTAVGARRLGFTGATLDMKTLCEAFPEFSELSPAETEDTLCIYKDWLRANRPAKLARCFPRNGDDAA